MTGRPISRRVVIGGIVGTAAIAAGGIGVAALVERDSGSSADGGTARTRSGDSPVGAREREAIARVGERYLEVEPADADEARLATALRDAGVDPEHLDRPDGLRDAARADFRRDAVVLVDGWVISRSEARYAALVALQTR